MPNAVQLAASRSRHAMYAALRRFFEAEGYEEVETPLLVPAPGMEPHISAFAVPFFPETGVGRARDLYLHTSPEYAMKRLLAEGAGPIFQICKVFRNGEVSRTHNPEFTLLEFYRPHADYHRIMADLERALAEVERAAGRSEIFRRLPFERLTVREALRRSTGIDLLNCPDAVSLARAAEEAGVRVGPGEPFEDVFFRVFLERVEPTLGLQRPTYVMDYPAPLASLARLRPEDPPVAERFELYAGGLELANGFSELNDSVEQRRRLQEEQGLRRATGRPAYPIDERFVEAVGRMPPSAGVAVGLDRVLMLLFGAHRIDEVLLFPAHEFFEEGPP
ncbi:MAG TPA: EF-P lysine aminoacylase EpmA [Myxococcaceae bacterium]|nr:EF-P lysine aminoacylase EpmA [Myxococcaceae bacterium]